MKIQGMCVVIGMAVTLSGCGTGRTSAPENVSTTTTETTVTATVVETKTVSTTQAPAPVPVSDAAVPVSASVPVTVGDSQQIVFREQDVDILAGAKKPCGTIAADAPKFVDPEETKGK